MQEHKAFWFLAGTQDLYGQEVIHQVEQNARALVSGLQQHASLPLPLVYQGTMQDSADILSLVHRANSDPACLGLVVWMHTFSPSKMWIAGLSRLQKPYLHLHTQFHRNLPFSSIDMDYMNLHQSAHGDREHGFITARLRLPRKVVAGHWQDAALHQKMATWMRAALGVFEGQHLSVCRFGDNMRQVAVTEGDKVEAQIVLGWQVNGYGVGDLIRMVDSADQEEIDAVYQGYLNRYSLDTTDTQAVRYQAQIEAGLRKFLTDGGFTAFTDTFQDLQGLRQLPGLAVQSLMQDGFGFGPEGDWKIAALGRVMKAMAKGLPGGTAFVEDYSYHLAPGNESVLGAHMLEVDPDIASDKPRIVVQPLGIGEREPPARLLFAATQGPAILCSLVDLGGRLRLIVADVTAIAPPEDMPRLPVAQVMWKPLPDLFTGAEAWILAGGAHHSVLSFALTAQHMQDYANILGIECIHIHQHTSIQNLRQQLQLSDLLYQLKGLR